MRLIHLIAPLVLFTCSSVYAADGVRFIQNDGQWHHNVQYRATLPGAYLYIEQDGLTVKLFDVHTMNRVHLGDTLPDHIQAHAIKTKFIGAQTPYITVKDKGTDYANYYIGNDPSRWAANVQNYGEVWLKEIYPGIDLRIYSFGQMPKYDWIVKPGADPSNIRLKVTGADDLELLNGYLMVRNSVDDYREEAPVSFTTNGSTKSVVRSAYRLEGNQLTYDFPEGYPKSDTLVIDPILVFSTYTGSTADNFGLTATYDSDGNVYGGGTVFATGQYPVTPGAFQMAFAVGGGLNARSDWGITKFDASGTSLIYSTYIGGSASSDAPHSMVCDENGNLCIYGTTGSSDFPVLPGAFDPTFNGGPSVNPGGGGYGVIYDPGVDIAVVKLNPNGTALLGSTFVGGTDTDGLNVATGPVYFYGDHFRGEIVLDDLGNAYIASTTQSADFPITASAPDPTYGGPGGDAAVFCLSSDLSTLLWSTYWGGTDIDAAYGIQRDAAGNVFVTGGTSSADLLTSPGALNNNLQGGIDGFVTKFSPNGISVLGSTYLGTSGFDQSYFVQLDPNDNVVVLGVSDGSNYPTTGTGYSNPGGTTFIHSLDNNLSSTNWSTVIGSGAGAVFSPTAFLVNNCGNLYLSGWGGDVGGAINAPGSTTSGLPVTPDAFMGTTSGEDFYLMVLEEEANSLIYATFFGGSSAEHVDGGTSRFDKEGRVYQAVCAGCGGNSDFPSTNGVWSETNNSTNCNLAVFKFDLNEIIADADFTINSVTCVSPVEVVFENLSSGASEFLWDFGDGSPVSTAFEDSHFYAQSGDYTITLIAIDSGTCLTADTVQFDIFVPGPPVVEVFAGDTVCSGESVQLLATGGATYEWSPATYLNDPNIADPIATPESPITYTVTVTDTNNCSTAVQAEVYLHPDVFIDAGMPDIADVIDPGELNAIVPPGLEILWTPPNGLDCDTCAVTGANPEQTTTYTIQVTDLEGCVHTDTVTVFVNSSLYVPNSFTPNWDGVNDVFQVYARGMKEFDLYIYNRWGEVIFQTDDHTAYWDGTYRGNRSPSDVYVWMIRYVDWVQPSVIQKKYGHVTLVR